jgi:hypothetical protein
LIAPPARLSTPTRAPATGSGAGTPDPGEAESADTPAEIGARIAALVARATTADDEALERQREEFDFVTRARAETEREINALRDMAIEQMKHEDELLKKWIALI